MSHEDAAFSRQHSAVREEAVSNQHSAVSEKQHQHQNQRPFTAEGAEDTEEIGSSGHPNIGTSENQNLPRMDADERGLRVERRPVEWKPSPDMYRMDTQEGMEAYEASFRMKIKPGSSGERRPTQGVVAPDDPGQVHANLG